MTENTKKKKQKPVYARGHGKERKVTAKQVLRCLYKWLNFYGWELEELKDSLKEVKQLLKSYDKRLTRIEAFLGGVESMDEILKDPDPNTYKDEQHK